MKHSSNDRVSQKQLAADLGVTERRVRQLVDERILPAGKEDLFDQPLCVSRYAMYRRGKEMDWSEFEAGLLAEGKKADRLVQAACSLTSTLKDIEAASDAVRSANATICFMTAVRSKSNAERALFWSIWDRHRDDACEALLSRVTEIAVIVDDDGKPILGAVEAHQVGKARMKAEASVRRARSSATR